jgi:hypothetical protein
MRDAGGTFQGIIHIEFDNGLRLVTDRRLIALAEGKVGRRLASYERLRNVVGNKAG